MKALKALVIFLGVLIVAGVGLVIYGIASKVGPKPAPAASTAASVPTPPNAAAAPVPAAPFGSVDIALPTGATIQQIFAAGDRVIVRVGGGKGAADRLIVLDPARGEVVGSFRFGASPEAEPTR